ncbi:hypothetical protein C5Y93_16940 [Blastopirellula marina]|uniref:Uncharacterized protein n=2 Tax=Blastopirellula marina TaxID=124 RepID=A0A2S8GL88_9BACT|nr:hypothetical protein C5Y93_16940 [Blastopirellula marina]
MVIVLMGIGYGVYTVLNQPEELPPEVAGAADELDLSMPEFPSMGMPSGNSASGGMPDSHAPQYDASSPPPAFRASSASPDSSDLPQFDNEPPKPQGYASGRLTAPQLGSSGSNAPSSGMPPTPDSLDSTGTDSGNSYSPQFAGAADLPPMNNSLPDNASQTVSSEASSFNPSNPAAGNPAAESHIPAAPDSSHNQLASVYSAGSSFDSPRAGAMNQAAGAPQGSFETAWDEAEVYLEQKDLVEASRRLTPWRNRPDLTPSQKEKLNLLLSQLGGTVVYSTEHTLEEPYTVGSGETIESIAQQFDIPPQLLQGINGISDPNQLTPGQKLKVIQGPFVGKVDLTHNELTLEVDGCYAGRFPITVENGAIIPGGEHEVLRKEANPQFFDAASQQVVPSGDPANPYGNYAIHLDGGVVLHGSGGPGGSISVSQGDAKYLYEILSIGSTVTVLR